MDRPDIEVWRRAAQTRRRPRRPPQPPPPLAAPSLRSPTPLPPGALHGPTPSKASHTVQGPGSLFNLRDTRGGWWWGNFFVSWFISTRKF